MARAAVVVSAAMGMGPMASASTVLTVMPMAVCAALAMTARGRLILLRIVLRGALGLWNL